MQIPITNNSSNKKQKDILAPMPDQKTLLFIFIKLPAPFFCL